MGNYKESDDFKKLKTDCEMLRQTAEFDSEACAQEAYQRCKKDHVHPRKCWVGYVWTVADKIAVRDDPINGVKPTMQLTATQVRDTLNWCAETKMLPSDCKI